MSAAEPRYELAPTFHMIIDNRLKDVWPYGVAAVHSAPHRAEYSDEDAQAVCDMLNAQEAPLSSFNQMIDRFFGIGESR